MRFGFNRSSENPEELKRQLEALAYERQRLREAIGARETLERNRLEIAQRQYELSHALVKRHLPDERAA